MRSIDRALRNGIGLVYVILARALWFGGGWLLIAWRVYSGLGIAGRRIAKRVSVTGQRVSEEITGRFKSPFLARPEVRGR
jgi:D-alanyl-lipoteichoic acid acyltransferase DltB (MBOAT superfamily)